MHEVNDLKILMKFVELNTRSNYYPWFKQNNATPMVMRFFNRAYNVNSVWEEHTQLVINHWGILPWNGRTNSGNDIAKVSIYQFITWLYEISSR